LKYYGQYVPDSSIRDRLQPWLERWSVADVPAAQTWFPSLSLGRFEEQVFLVQHGQHSDALYLLETGLVRLFYTTPDGKERNKGFYCAGQITGPVSAAMTSSPAPFSIQALEPVEALCFRYGDLVSAAGESEEMALLFRRTLAEAFIRNERREALLLTCNAEQRYQWLLEHEPHLLDRVAQFHLASYLGVDAVTLSRLKKKFR
jgi:CRP-like cAMP-binding protein